ncbi:MAG: hypothetical protein ABIH40_06170 [Candidatus Omnitrophota bacterium]
MRVISLFRYFAISLFAGSLGFVFLDGYALAEELKLEGVITRIPASRILGWGCTDSFGNEIPSTVMPEVDRATTPEGTWENGWEQQALETGDKIRCPDDLDSSTNNYVVVGLSRSAEVDVSNRVSIEEGGQLTISGISEDSVSAVYQDSGGALFDIGVLLGSSTFSVETPTATVGVTGTTFCVTVYDNDVDVDGDPQTVGQGDYTYVQLVEVAPDKNLTVTDKNPDAGDLSSYPLNSGDEVQIIAQDANVWSEGVVFEDSVSPSGKHLGQWKQKSGEIAKKSRGKKAGFYKESEEEDDDD